MGTHLWLRADRREARDAMRERMALSPVVAVVDAHRQLRGPYTAAGTLLRAIGHDALELCPELGPRHHVELQQSVPELAVAVPPRGLHVGIKTNQRTRYEARLHTLRISNGLVEFVRDYLLALGCGPRTLVVENAHEADATDREFLAVLLRRIDPDLLTVVVGTSRAPVDDPPGPVPVSLAQALQVRTTHFDAPHGEPTATVSADDESADLARAYVESDGVSDDPRHLAAYLGLAPEERAALHDERHDILVAVGEPTLLLGAVPYHAEHGSDPAGVGARAIRHAQRHCRLFGFYYPAAELGSRGRRLVDPTQEWELWLGLAMDEMHSLSSAGRADEALAVIDQVRQRTQDATVHMTLAYETAMIFTRHYEDARRDHDKARGWLNLAIGMSALLEDPLARLFYSVFNRNGLALVEVRQGRMEEAVRLVTEGMARMEREMPPGEYVLHRIGLQYNRGQVLGMMGRYEEALADYTTAIAADPFFADSHFNRGNILFALGRYEEALADFDRALELSPPFHEGYYNRAASRLELGDLAGALADFGRVLELAPDNVDSLLNRASILCDLGDLDAAWQESSRGLAIDPSNPRLLALQGRLLVQRGDTDGAQRALAAALAVDDTLAEAWAIRGELAFNAGDLETATEALDRAVELADAPEMRFNRAVVREAAGHLAQAATDYAAAFAATGDPEARSRLDHCETALRPGVLVADVR